MKCSGMYAYVFMYAFVQDACAHMYAYAQGSATNVFAVLERIQITSTNSTRQRQLSHGIQTHLRFKQVLSDPELAGNEHVLPFSASDVHSDVDVHVDAAESDDGASESDAADGE
jgi:hypothetical protein